MKKSRKVTLQVDFCSRVKGNMFTIPSGTEVSYFYRGDAAYFTFTLDGREKKESMIATMHAQEFFPKFGEEDEGGEVMRRFVRDLQEGRFA